MTKAMARERFSAFIVLTAALLLAAPMAQAMKIQQQNLTQLITESQSIVHGTVKSVTDGIDANNVPYTEVTIAVGSAAKGNHEPESTLTFRQFGLLEPRDLGNGKLRIAMTPEGFPRWHEGETVVAFMYKPASRTGLQTTAGLAQGKLSLSNDMLANEFNNAGMFDGVEIDPALLTPEQQNMLTTPGAVDARAFMDLISRAVDEGWIENGEMR